MSNEFNKPHKYHGRNCKCGEDKLDKSDKPDKPDKLASFISSELKTKSTKSLDEEVEEDLRARDPSKEKARAKIDEHSK